MSLFLEEESKRDLTKPKIRVKGQAKDETESDGNNLVVLDVTRQFVMTPVYLQSRLANMSCHTSIAGLNNKLMMKYPIESSRLSVVSSANKKEGFLMVKESILPMAELKNLTRNELIVYASQFNGVVQAIDLRDRRIEEIRVLNRGNGGKATYKIGTAIESDPKTR